MFPGGDQFTTPALLPTNRWGGEEAGVTSSLCSPKAFLQMD